jgi:hypothetical protein
MGKIVTTVDAATFLRRANHRRRPLADRAEDMREAAAALIVILWLPLAAIIMLAIGG